jgi:DNA-binding transcriptional MerR regulator
MSKYTTGEIAKLCGVSVRTVQYYDTVVFLLPVNSQREADGFIQRMT